MIGAIGQDAAGTAYRERLLNEGIAVQHIKETEEPTGTALINLLPSGENTIVVFPGANQTLSPEDVTWAGEAIQSAEILLVQLEVPVETVVNAIQIANRSGTRVIFNPSPFRPDFPWAEVFIDVLIVNEGEAEQLDATAPDGEDLPIGCLIITHGAEPVEVIMPDGDFTFQPPSVTPVDTVGAGDTFAGTLAARLALGDSIQSAVAIANTAAARSTLQVGAQEAMPYAAEIGV
jgi:ribokinase